VSRRAAWRPLTLKVIIEVQSDRAFDAINHPDDPR
jgi:hypothetical protein